MLNRLIGRNGITSGSLHKIFAEIIVDRNGTAAESLNSLYKTAAGSRNSLYKISAEIIVDRNGTPTEPLNSCTKISVEI